MPATSPNWYFAWQALSRRHSPDFPAGRARPCFDSHFSCFLLLPGRITQLQRSGEGCDWWAPNCQRYCCSGGGGVFSMAQGAGPGPLGVGGHYKALGFLQMVASVKLCLFSEASIKTISRPGSYLLQISFQQQQFPTHHATPNIQMVSKPAVRLVHHDYALG